MSSFLRLHVLIFVPVFVTTLKKIDSKYLLYFCSISVNLAWHTKEDRMNGTGIDRAKIEQIFVANFLRVTSTIICVAKFSEAEERLRTEGIDADTSNEHGITALHLATIGGI